MLLPPNIRSPGLVLAVLAVFLALILSDAHAANTPISELTNGGFVAPGDEIPVAFDGQNFRVNVGNVAGTNAGANLEIDGLNNLNVVIGNGYITNAMLSNSSFILGSTSIALGGTATTVSGLTLSGPTLSGTTTFAGITGSTQCLEVNSSGIVSGTPCGGGMVYPGAGIPQSTGSAWGTSITPGTGVAAALGVSVGSAGAFVVNGGALGTPSGGTLTNATGLPVSSGISGLGTGVATALVVNVGSSGAFVTNGGALGTPSSGTLTNATGLPISGIASLGTGVGAALADATNGTGGFITYSGNLGTPTAGVATNLTGTATALNIGGNAATATATSLGTAATATNPSRTGDVTTGFYSAATGTVAVAGAGIEAMQWNTLASGVDYLSVTPGNSGTAPQIAVAGGTTNQGLSIQSKGSGQLSIAGGSGGTIKIGYSGEGSVAVQGSPVSLISTGNIIFSNGSTNELVVLPTSSQVDYLQIAGSVTGTPGNVTLSAAGTDSAVSIILTPKGTGGVAIGTTTSSGELNVAGAINTTTQYNVDGSQIAIGNLANIAAGTIVGNNTGSSAAPSASTAPVLGINSSTTGTLGLASAGGATTTISPSSSTASAWTLTLPTTGGTSGYALQTNGSGVTSWSANANAYTVLVGPSATTADTLVSKFNQIVDVTQYGAVGDNATNNATVVQNAINNNQSGVIFFPLNGSNIYQISGPLLMTDTSSSPVHNFQGDIVCAHGVELYFTNAGNSTDADSAMQNGFQFYPTVNSSAGQTAGWNKSSANGGTFQGCIVKGPAHGAGLHMGNSIDIQAFNNVFENDRYGLVTEASINVQSKNNVYLNNTNAGIYWAETGNSSIYYGATPASTYWNDDHSSVNDSFQTSVAGGLAFILDAGSQSERIRYIIGDHAITNAFADQQYFYVARNVQPTIISNWFENINYPIRLIAANAAEGGSTTTLTGVTGAEPSGAWEIGTFPDGYSYGATIEGNYFESGTVDINVSGITSGSVVIGQNLSNNCQSGGYHIETNQGGTAIIDFGDTALGSCSYKNINYSTYLTLAGLTSDSSGDYYAKSFNAGTAGSTLGSLTVSGNTSGTVTIKPQAAAGSWTLTLPTSGGLAGDVLQTDGSGNTSWGPGAGLTAWTTSDFSVASSTSLTAITTFNQTLSVVSGHTYHISFYFPFTATASTGGYQYDLGGGSGACTVYGGRWDVVTATGATAAGGITALSGSWTSGSTVAAGIAMKGDLTCVATGSGTIIPRFAQDSSNSSASLAKAASMLTVQELY